MRRSCRARDSSRGRNRLTRAATLPLCVLAYSQKRQEGVSVVQSRSSRITLPTSPTARVQSFIDLTSIGVQRHRYHHDRSAERTFIASARRLLAGRELPLGWADLSA